MSTISLRVPEEELNIIKSYAKINNKSLSAVIRSIVLEHIEGEYDLQVFAEYEKEKAKGNVKTYSHEEVWAKLGL